MKQNSTKKLNHEQLEQVAGGVLVPDDEILPEPPFLRSRFTTGTMDDVGI